MNWEATIDQVTAAFTDLNALERTTVRIGARRFTVAVASTPSQWAVGLTRPLEPGLDGMLFAMPRGSTIPFHMNGVSQPLLAVFFDEDGQVVDLNVMRPHTGVFRPVAPYTTVLELVGENANWPAAVSMVNDLAMGLKVEGLAG